MSYVDLHFHLLPAVDDGPADVDDAVELARAAVADGSGTVVATPHVHPDWNTDTLELAERVRELRGELDRAGVDLALECGGELAHCLVGDLDQRELDAIAQGPKGARWLLVETPFEGMAEDFHAATTELRSRGFGILLAHPERSAEVVFGDGAGLRRELSEGALVQLTAASLTGGHGEEARVAAVELLQSGVVTLISSDAHGPTRPPALSEAHRALATYPVLAHLADPLVADAPRRLLERGTRLRGALAA